MTEYKLVRWESPSPISGVLPQASWSQNDMRWVCALSQIPQPAYWTSLYHLRQPRSQRRAVWVSSKLVIALLSIFNPIAYIPGPSFSCYLWHSKNYAVSWIRQSSGAPSFISSGTHSSHVWWNSWPQRLSAHQSKFPEHIKYLIFADIDISVMISVIVMRRKENECEEPANVITRRAPVICDFYEM